jgi:hypothetical protein
MNSNSKTKPVFQYTDSHQSELDVMQPSDKPTYPLDASCQTRQYTRPLRQLEPLHLLQGRILARMSNFIRLKIQTHNQINQI